MQSVVQAGMDACDTLGVQSAWFFLAMGTTGMYARGGEVLMIPTIGFLVGPLALLVSAVQDPTILTSVKRSQRAAFAT